MPAGRVPVLPASLYTKVTVKLPFQSTARAAPTGSGKATVSACRRVLSWASVPVSVSSAVPVPTTLPPLPPTALNTSPEPAGSVTVAVRLVAPLSSGSAITMFALPALSNRVAEASATVTLFALIEPGSLIEETNTDRVARTTL